MTYRIQFTSAARRQLDKLPRSVMFAVLEFCAGPLAANPHRVGKPLRGPLAGFYSARRGEYRVIYSIFDDEVRVEVVSIARRSNAYRPH
jgi:mRNA interferase RelE/StbE